MSMTGLVAESVRGEYVISTNIEVATSSIEAESSTKCGVDMERKCPLVCSGHVFDWISEYLTSEKILRERDF